MSGIRPRRVLLAASGRFQRLGAKQRILFRYMRCKKFFTFDTVLTLNLDEQLYKALTLFSRYRFSASRLSEILTTSSGLPGSAPRKWRKCWL
jgi:hypothetical protein